MSKHCPIEFVATGKLAGETKFYINAQVAMTAVDRWFAKTQMGHVKVNGRLCFSPYQAEKAVGRFFELPVWQCTNNLWCGAVWRADAVQTACPSCGRNGAHATHA